LLFTTIYDKDGTEISASTLKGKLIALYFSASWCGPCVKFTPLLAEKYEEVQKEGGDFEVVFISADEGEEDCLNYYSKMPWKRLAFNQEKLDELMNKYEVQGFPTVVLLDRDGSVVSNEAERIIVTNSFSEWKNAIAAKKAAEEKFARDLEAL
jgi:nucleoredoxin